jgi:uroporphyrinogen decarboxylase
MNNREVSMAILNYQPYDHFPVVHFGFWDETMAKWAEEGHITWEEARGWGDGNAHDTSIGHKLGFDFNWYSCFHFESSLKPGFQRHLVQTLPDGSREVMNGDGVIVVEKDEAGSIPSEVSHTLKDRKSWEEQYRHRLNWSMDRVNWAALDNLPAQDVRDHPIGIHCGSLWGRIRDITGLVGLSYMISDEPDLVDEMIEVTSEICYQGTKAILEHYDHFDFAHFWEDICYRAGPLVNPKFFQEKIGPHYKRITELVNSHGINIVSLDCDGKIDKLIPTWIANGVNTMFPIEVGTWNASMTPWREQYGKELRGVGGMNKVVFSRDYAAVDAEIERLKPMVEMGGFIPCPDHRIAPDAKWENVQYYCEQMHKVFG